MIKGNDDVFDDDDQYICQVLYELIWSFHTNPLNIIIHKETEAQKVT